MTVSLVPIAEQEYDELREMLLDYYEELADFDAEPEDPEDHLERSWQATLDDMDGRDLLWIVAMAASPQMVDELGLLDDDTLTSILTQLLQNRLSAQHRTAKRLYTCVCIHIYTYNIYIYMCMYDLINHVEMALFISDRHDCKSEMR